MSKEQIRHRIIDTFLIACAIIVFAFEVRAENPTPNANRYIATANTTALTVQQPATNANTVLFETASVYCASASTITPTWNGAAATATTLAIKKSPQTVAPALATAWSSSNGGVTGGVTGVVYNVPAGGTFTFDMSLVTLNTGLGTAANFTFTTSNSCTITMTWVEK